SCLPVDTLGRGGFELLYQPEVVRLYLSILTESQNFNTLEAAAGALQNLSAGTWMVSGGARAREKGLGAVGGAGPVRLRVGGATALGARRPLLATRGGDLQLGSYAMAELVRNLPSRQQRTAKNLEEDTVVAVLNTIHEIITDSAENARSLVQTQGIQKLVGIGKSSPSMRETKAASHVLQMVWSYKELRGALQKDGWNKAHFQVSAGGRGSRRPPHQSPCPASPSGQESISPRGPPTFSPGAGLEKKSKGNPPPGFHRAPTRTPGPLGAKPPPPPTRGPGKPPLPSHLKPGPFSTHLIPSPSPSPLSWPPFPPHSLYKNKNKTRETPEQPPPLSYLSIAP
uniref:ARVCF delta catenin family member n=1 Tax=Sarcophilus harrisii TaxID=9305 RepID=A0A7N4PA25_SARHA